MTDRIRLLLVDDHPVVREGLRALIATEPDMEVVGEAADGGFEGDADDGATLAGVLRRHDVTSIDVVGLATGHCDRATALDGRREGFGVRVLLPLCAGVAPDTTQAALEEMSSAGVDIVTDLADA